MRFVFLRGGLRIRSLELQGERDGRIVEPGDCGVGHRQALGLAAESQRHGEEGLPRGQIPVLVLQHDPHLFGILSEHLGRSRDPGGLGPEGDVEVVVARKALRRGRALERHFHDAAQGVLGHGLIVHLVS